MQCKAKQQQTHSIVFTRWHARQQPRFALNFERANNEHGIKIWLAMSSAVL
jgi:hypothetical protein